MIKTTEMIRNELTNYKNPADKLKRLVKQGIYIPIINGLYETNKDIEGYYLAGSIYGPSYLSFEFALFYYGFIPEAVYVYTSATTNKNRTRKYNTKFGEYTYRDIPKKAYPFEINIIEENGYSFLIASREKAVCDMLYKLPVMANQKELKAVLFESLRLDEEMFNSLNKETMISLSKKYRSKNLGLLENYLRREIK